MSRKSEIRAELERIGSAPGDTLDVAEAALLLAAARRPRASLDRYRRHLDQLVDETASYMGDDAVDGPDDPDLVVEALEQVLVKRYGYRGDDDDADGEDGDLMGLIDNRKGPAEVLCVLYVHVARAVGCAASGIDFPGRALVRFEPHAERVIVDPLAGGRRLRTEDMRDILKAVNGNGAELEPAHYRAMDDRDLLVRLQEGIKSRLLARERADDALGVIEATLLVAPGAGGLWRESGLLNARAGNVSAAVAALEEFLRRCPGDGASYRASVLLQELRGRMS